MGSGTTALVANINNMNSMGYDILPMSKISILAKSSVLKYDLSELENMINLISHTDILSGYTEKPMKSLLQQMPILIIMV